MTLVIDVFGWIGAAALLAAYWLVSTEKASGNSRTYQGMNLVGAVLVLANSLYYGAYPSVGVNAIWIVIGAYAMAMQLVHATSPERYSEADRRSRNEPGESRPLPGQEPLKSGARCN